MEHCGTIVFCTGTFDRTLDQKHRLLMPKSVRKILEASQGMFLTPGVDGCLELHNNESIEKRSDEAAESRSSSRNKKSFLRMFFAQAEECDLDPQSRIRIPLRLAEWAKLESRVVIIGVGSHWEIWDELSWRDYLQQHKSEFDDITDALWDGLASNSFSGESAVSGESAKEQRCGKPGAPR